ncbi:hypothetical protein [Saccharibacillus sacchari]|uniref:hypothetical protein n=1 Tax=Saccharibacillus sacchari TaxID=456493 RepID=UPI0004B2A5A7|nr:hypothetical protein [Saccharibacillus sacchari]
MFTIMMLLTGMLSSFSTPDLAPSHAAAAVNAPTIVTSAFTASEPLSVSAYPSQSGLETLNGLTLQDRIQDADRLYGEASDKTSAYMAGDEHNYGNVKVGAYEDWIYYVSVPGSTGHFNLNGRELPMDADQIREQLGMPDFTADDGFGYEHDGQAIKVFIDPLSGEVRSVDLFDNTSV